MRSEKNEEQTTITFVDIELISFAKLRDFGGIEGTTAGEKVCESG